VILLMFGVGLHFHVRDLLAVRRIAIAGALGQIAASMAIGATAARAFGWSWSAAALFGVALSVASTVVLTRVLAENNDLNTQTGRIAVGWLIVEDIFTVLVLVILPPLLGLADASVPAAVGLSTLKLAALTALILGAGVRSIPQLLSSVER